MTLSYFDLAILFLVTISSFLGAYRGLIYIIVNLIGLAATIFLTLQAYPYMVSLVEIYIQNELVVSIASGAVTFVISLFLCAFIVAKILVLLQNNNIAIFDRLLGLIAGIIRGVLIAILSYLIINIFVYSTYKDSENLADVVDKALNQKIEKKDQDWQTKSIITKHLNNLSVAMFNYIPRYFLESVKLRNDDEQKEKTEDVIDVIRKKKGDIRSEIEIPMNEDLENEIQAILSK